MGYEQDFRLKPYAVANNPYEECLRAWVGDAHMPWSKRSQPPYSSMFRNQFKPDMIKKVIFNPPATIVYWADGSKTVVKCSPDDVFDPEKGLAMAICKYTFGNDYSFHRIFKKWISEEEKTLIGEDVLLSSIQEPLRKVSDFFNKLFAPTDEL